MYEVLWTSFMLTISNGTEKNFLDNIYEDENMLIHQQPKWFSPLFSISDNWLLSCTMKSLHL